jgi:hypothetical protein
MIPKEKAKELVNKQYSLITGMELSYVSKLIYLPKGDTNYETAKQCALVVVDEMIKEYKRIAIPYIADKSYVIDMEYWQEVKQEIEKL